MLRVLAMCVCVLVSRSFSFSGILSEGLVRSLVRLLVNIQPSLPGLVFVPKGNSLSVY